MNVTRGCCNSAKDFRLAILGLHAVCYHVYLYIGRDLIRVEAITAFRIDEISA